MTAEDNPKRGLLGRLFGSRGRDDAAGPAPVAAEAEDTPPEAAAFETAEADTAEPPPAVMAEPEPVMAPPTAAPTPRLSWFQRLKSGLAKSSSQLTRGITDVFSKRKLDDATLDELEDLLIQSDLGLETANRITARLKAERYDKSITPEDVRQVLASEITRVLQPVARPLLVEPSHRPHVILMVGVNGTGKTTTIGKLAERYRKDGLKVMLAAGDTFRAAAIDQLKIWGGRTGAAVLARDVGSDAASLAFEAVTEAKSGGYDLLLIDTAGRLQNKEGLMQELEKVVRVIKKVDPSAPHDVLLTLDATTGQNALSQVEIFGKRAGVTGLVMTKLDGTARGGILVALAAKYALPVHAIGVGEGAEDLQAFDAADFASAIVGQ